MVGARTIRQQGPQLIDVRERYEFAAGYATGARNVPLGQLNSRLGDLRADTTVLLTFPSGNRSGTARALLRRHGLTPTRNGRGGMMAWHAAGLPEQ